MNKKALQIKQNRQQALDWSSIFLNFVYSDSNSQTKKTQKSVKSSRPMSAKSAQSAQTAFSAQSMQSKSTAQSDTEQ